MAEDTLNPTDYTPVQANIDKGISLSDVSGYYVSTLNTHGHGGDGGRITLDLAIPKEIIESVGGVYDGESDNISPEILAFHDAVRCALAEKGLDAAGSDLFGGRGSLLIVNDQSPEDAYYRGKNESFSGVGNTMANPDMQDFARDGEKWSPVDITRIYIADNAATAGMSEEELAEVVRQAYYEAFHGVDDADIPKVEYRGDGLNADVDDMPKDAVQKECTPAVPMA